MLSPCCLTNCLFEVAFALSTLTLPLHVQANSAGATEASPTANSACPYGTLRGGTVVTRGKNWQWGDEDVDVSAPPPKLAEGYVLDDVACGNWASVQWTFSQERAYKYRWYVVDGGANDGAAGNVATRTKVDVDLFIIRRAQPLTATVTTEQECEAPPGRLLEARWTRRVLHHSRLRDPVRPRDAGLRQTRCERDLRGIWMYRPLNEAGRERSQPVEASQGQVGRLARVCCPANAVGQALFRVSSRAYLGYNL